MTQIDQFKNKQQQNLGYQHLHHQQDYSDGKHQAHVQDQANSQFNLNQNSKVLFVSNLDYGTDEPDLQALFSKFKVESFTLFKYPRRFAGRALVLCETPEDATAAQKELDGTFVGNRKLSVQFAEQQEIKHFKGNSSDRSLTVKDNDCKTERKRHDFEYATQDIDKGLESLFTNAVEQKKAMEKSME